MNDEERSKNDYTNYLNKINDRERSKIDLIKLLRAKYFIHLKEAKDIVENYLNKLSDEKSSEIFQGYLESYYPYTSDNNFLIEKLMSDFPNVGYSTAENEVNKFFSNKKEVGVGLFIEDKKKFLILVESCKEYYHANSQEEADNFVKWAKSNFVNNDIAIYVRQ